MKIKLSDWCRQQGIHYRTGYNYVKKGHFGDKVEITSSGSIFILVPDETREEKMFQMIEEMHGRICK